MIPAKTPSHPFWAELARWIFLVGVCAWLFHPFANSRLLGSGDALWYVQVLADYVEQLRHGIFPVFIGQTDWAWNGAIYPLRVAPLYQHLGGLIDLLTGHSLGYIALQHAVVLSVAGAGCFTAYLSLRALLPSEPWIATLLTVLYLSCPGVLGPLYTQDLYMTWMTLPWLPLAFYGTIRAYQRDDWKAQFFLAIGVAGTWLAHAPIALWLSMALTVIHGVRLTTIHRQRAAWIRALIGVGIFILLGSYPFISMATLGVAQVAAPGPAIDTDGLIQQAISSAYPQMLLPVSEAAKTLGDLQLGYALWAILIALAISSVVVCCQRTTRLYLLATMLVAFGLILLLLPIPHVTSTLWALIPAQIKQVTIYWPMQRFYFIVAPLLVITVAAAQSTPEFNRPHLRNALLVVLCLGAGWSLIEARQFVRAGKERTASEARSQQMLLPENRSLMNHSYGLYEAPPDDFTNGVTSPWSQIVLRDPTTKQIIKTDATEPSIFTQFNAAPDLNPGILKIDAEFRLEPNRHYYLDFDFGDREYHGILQLSGSRIFREYALPKSGGPNAFGSTASNPHSIALWTTGTTVEHVQLRFIPTALGETPASYMPFAKLRLRDATLAPVQLVSTAPLTLVTKTAIETKIELHRMFLAGYSAKLDGQPNNITPSRDGRLQLSCPAGEHTLSLYYTAPWPTQLSYWATIATWGGCCLTLLAAGSPKTLLLLNKSINRN